eukprot:1273014-Rhodomonas_salina.1
MRQQLEAIALLGGMTPAVRERIRTIATEVGQTQPLNQIITSICGSGDDNKIHTVIAKASITPELDMTVRVQLAQIAIELYQFWKAQNDLTAATFDPSLPVESRVLSIRFGKNTELFESVCGRLGIMAGWEVMSVGQKEVMATLAKHPLLVERTDTASTANATMLTEGGTSEDGGKTKTGKEKAKE